MDMLDERIEKAYYDIKNEITSAVVSTSRTIKPMHAWKGQWPALREFFQNTFDYYKMYYTPADAAPGLTPALRLEQSSDGSNSIFTFLCAGLIMCVITVGDDDLVIEQRYTFPMHPRSLETGVDDTTKNKGEGAGGFGDGFKTATIALFAQPQYDCKILWSFEHEGTKIDWEFVRHSRDAISTFSKTDVLEVHIQVEHGVETPIDHVMRQNIHLKGVGKSFFDEVIPRFQVFWNPVRMKLIFDLKTQEYLAEACDIPTVVGSIAQAGVYVKGIYVRPSFIDGAVMAFYPSLNVCGRDRDNVYIEEVQRVTGSILRSYCYRNKNELKKLCLPLMGTNRCDSWLLARGAQEFKGGPRSHPFINRIIEDDPALFYRILDVPKDAMFVSRKTTKSDVIFVQWATSYLREKDAPLYEIQTGCDKKLFPEVTEETIIERCAKELKRELRASDDLDVKRLASCFRKLFAFSKTTKFRTFFSSRVGVPFVHDFELFLPVTPLTRDLILKVFSNVQRKLGEFCENFQFLTEALFKVTTSLPDNAALNLEHMVKIVNMAEGIRRKHKGIMFVSSEVRDVGENGQELCKCLNSKIAQIGKFSSIRGDLFEASPFAPDASEEDETEEIRAPLLRIEMAGIVIFADAASAERLVLDIEEQSLMVEEYRVLQHMKGLVAEILPGLRQTLTKAVFAAYDTNATYLGFTSSQGIFVNLVAHRDRDIEFRTDLLNTLLHELSHVIEHTSGHGIRFRDTLDTLHGAVLEGMSKQCYCGAFDCTDCTDDE